MKPRIQLAVRTLVELMLRSGDLSYGFGGGGRPLEGIRAHQKIQKEWPAGYQPEVGVSREIETKHHILCISGRIDGVYHGPEGVVVDEIKSTRRGLDEIAESQDPIHWGQVKVYAYLYALEHDLDTLDCQLTYYRMDTGDVRQLRRSYIRGDLASFFNTLIQGYLEWADRLAHWQTVRDRSVATLEFPFATYRPGQRDMAVAAYRTIRDQGQLIVEAATGIGKTMAMIFASIKALGAGVTRKVFYLTARSTGKAVAEHALDLLRADGLRLKSLTLTAKDKLCFEPESACSGEECSYAKGHYDRIDQALNHMFQADGFTRETVVQAALRFRVCPFELSLELAWWADVIICDYNYAFDPRVYLRRFFQEAQGVDTFLVDEAHNLVDRSREMFSSRISKQPFLDVRRKLKKDLPKLHKQMGRINTRMLSLRKQCAVKGGFVSQDQPPADVYPHLRAFVHMVENWLIKGIQAPFREVLLELYFETWAFLKIAEGYDSTYVTTYESAGADLHISLLCLDPSARLAVALKRCRSVLLFSATLSPFQYFRQILGLHKDAQCQALPSPFRKQHRCLIIAKDISTYYRDRSRTLGALVDRIITLVGQKKGNYMVFCPSYKYLAMIHEDFSNAAGDIETLVQTAEMDEAQRERFLERFATDRDHTLVGFAVMGGVFGEGVDLVGERLSGAAIVGVGLPGITPQRNLIRGHFNQRLNAGFEYAYMYPGFTRVLQAAGRVIRSEKDRGVILLMDSRFATFRYRELFPRDWRPEYVQTREEMENVLQQFWGGGCNDTA